MRKFIVAVLAVLALPFVTQVIPAGPTALFVSQHKPTPTATATATVAGPTLVQQKTGTNVGNTIQVTLDSETTPGNVIVVCVDYVPTANVIEGITDSTSNSYAQQVSATGTSIASDIWAVTDQGFGGNTVVTVTQTSVLLRLTVNVSEWSGLASETAEATHTGTGTASATVSTGVVTPISTHNLLIACGGWTANDYSTGPTNSFTRMTQAGGGAVYLESAYLFQPTAVANSTGWGLTTGINWSAVIVSLPVP